MAGNCTGSFSFRIHVTKAMIDAVMKAGLSQNGHTSLLKAPPFSFHTITVSLLDPPCLHRTALLLWSMDKLSSQLVK